MQNWNYKVLGVMSGTSLDGIDLAVIQFKLTEKWEFEILAAQTLAYPKEWVQKLNNAISLDDAQLLELNRSFTSYLADVILQFKKIHPAVCSSLDAICSHGHTIKHEPKKGFTLQIGNLPELAGLVGETIVCNFRVQDVEMGGQGAPLVPIGDELLFSEYNYCLNLGGFANISTRLDSRRVAYDICAVNTVLNFYSEKLGFDYDDKGKIAASGKLNDELLLKLDQLDHYFQKPPKSLGIEWAKKEVFPLLLPYEKDIPSILHTYTVHVARQITNCIENNAKTTVLVTGGGAYNDFLISKIKNCTKARVIIPSKELIEYKEAVIFGFLGVLKLRNEVNVLKSVTGAVKDHSSGVIFQFKK